MDSSELAAKLLVWEKRIIELEELEAEIKEAVLELKTTQKVGNVTATFSNGRRELDYETPGQFAPVEIIDSNTVIDKFTDWEAVSALIDPDIVEECTREVKRINWSSVCKDAKIEPAVTKEGTPSVTIKLKK